MDGNPSTRWASDWSEAQSITVDLGSVQQVGRVILSWEAAYGKGYRFRSPLTGSLARHRVHCERRWRTGQRLVRADNACFVRMAGATRGTNHGYSLYEFEVYAQYR